MLLNILNPSIVLFMYTTVLTINNGTYHRSNQHNQIAFYVKPGQYLTNAYSTKIFPATNILRSETMNKECDTIAESITYNHITPHLLNINWGSPLNYTKLLINNTPFSFESNGYLSLLLPPGLHMIDLYVAGCHDPTELETGRFLRAWIYNTTENKLVSEITQLYSIYEPIQQRTAII